MKLREYRIKSLLTMQELADAIGVSRHTVWKWEKGLSMPQARYLRKLTTTLNIPKEEIVTVVAQTK